MHDNAIASSPARRPLNTANASMNYFHAMWQVLTWRQDGYRRIAAANRSLRYCVVNVSLLGIAYGIGALFFSDIVVSQGAGPIQFNPLMILMAGMSVAFLMHGGAALFCWVFSRGIGGNPQFMPVYLNLGIAALALLPLAPALAAFQAGLQGSLLLLFTVAVGGYAIGPLYLAMRAAAGLAHWKMVLAALAAVVYIGCFLYLWL
ncbi:MAG: hypothetical protein QNJ22_22710 [Desulfosarcinaceae bacterium]|nr:hypothetical protein [Desulfosarcinaceae bacterium]